MTSRSVFWPALCSILVCSAVGLADPSAQGAAAASPHSKAAAKTQSAEHHDSARASATHHEHATRPSASKPKAKTTSSATAKTTKAKPAAAKPKTAANAKTTATSATASNKPHGARSKTPGWQRAHDKRVARLKKVEADARAKGDTKTADRAGRLLAKENAHYAKVVKAHGHKKSST